MSHLLSPCPSPCPILNDQHHYQRIWRRHHKKDSKFEPEVQIVAGDTGYSMAKQYYYIYSQWLCDRSLCDSQHDQPDSGNTQRQASPGIQERLAVLVRKRIEGPRDKPFGRPKTYVFAGQFSSVQVDMSSIAGSGFLV